MNFVPEEERPCMEHHVWHPEVGRGATRASYQVAMSPRLPRDSGTLCLRTKWQAIVRAGAQQWYLWYLRQPGLQISTELVIKEERAHVEWKPSQWSCCWVGRDVSQVKLSKFTVHVLHCLPEFVHSLLMVLCYTFVFIFWKLNEWVWWELVYVACFNVLRAVIHWWICILSWCWWLEEEDDKW